MTCRQSAAALDVVVGVAIVAAAVPGRASSGPQGEGRTRRSCRRSCRTRKAAAEATRWTDV